MEGNDGDADGDADGGGRGGGGEEWWWAASFAQLAWGIYSFRKGYSGDSRLMPLKAFSVASLFLGSTATAGVGTLRSSGIHSYTLRVSIHGMRVGVGLDSEMDGYYAVDCVKAVTLADLVLDPSIIAEVEDMKEVGANIRTGLGVRPRARDN
ncbi:hypothetical protein RJ639_005804 [Escallonia herrerae]|uniref:Uncharacterized protein n=1 Tax=Escallonia herrerae TaxID=1293975 RepID=A0AA89AVD5_9ASTE|nr:hypothetical protein RJ639_005804 [Escallonia herrerae]